MLLAKRKIQRSQLKPYSIWEFSSDDEKFEKEMVAIYQKRANELLELEEEEKQLALAKELETNENLLLKKSEGAKNQESDNERGAKEKDKKKKKHKKQKEKKKHSKKHKKKKKKRSSSESSSSENEYSDIEKGLENPNEGPHLNHDDNLVIGPMPFNIEAITNSRNNYGGQLLPGEGSAMAQFIQSGKRIPRRGEVGLSSDQIERFEDLGYVMSGSRHKRMTAVRLRKENQVYSAEEKKALKVFNYEQKIKREEKVMEEMSTLLDSQLKRTN